MRSLRIRVTAIATMAAGLTLAAMTGLGIPASAASSGQPANLSNSATSTPKEVPDTGETINRSCGFYTDFATTKRGDTGNRVREVQCLLKEFSYNPGPTDGIFGERTENAVKAFQTATWQFCTNHLVIDGIVGVNTWRVLRSETGCP